MTGAELYVQGMAAMAKFQTEIYQACRRAFIKHRPELTNSIGLSLEGEPKLHIYPKQDEADGTDATIGLELNQKGIVRLNIYVWWRYGNDSSPQLSVVASVYCDRGEVRARLWAAFKNGGAANVANESGELWTEHPIAPTDFPNLEEKLDTLLTDWTQIWNTIGGLKKYLSA